MRRVGQLRVLKAGRRYSDTLPGFAFGMSDEDREIYEMARTYGQNEILPHAPEWDANKVHPVEKYVEMGELGLGAIYCDAAYGGSGLSRYQASLIFEGLSRACISTTAYLSIHNMCNWIVHTYASDSIKSHHCDKFNSCEHLLSYCLTEPGAGSDAASLTTRAEYDAGEYVLTGEKAFISGAGVSSHYIIMARTGKEGAKGISCFLVPKEAKGLSFGANERKLGWNSQPTRAVILDHVRVSEEARIGAEGDGFKIAMAALDGGRVNIASCSLGGASMVLDRTHGYLQERKQFGRALSSFPTIQHRMASSYAAFHSARTILRDACMRLDANDASKTLYCAMAKYEVTEKMVGVVDDCLQHHGGYGYLDEYDIHRYLRDMRVHRILEGTSEVMQLITARNVGIY